MLRQISTASICNSRRSVKYSDDNTPWAPIRGSLDSGRDECLAASTNLPAESPFPEDHLPAF